MDIEFNDDAMSAAFDSAMADAVDEPASDEPVESSEEVAPVEASEDQGVEQEEAKPDEVQPLDPPARWSATHKEKFASLPREAQEILLEREADVTKHLTQRTQELAERSRSYQQIEEVIAPRRQQFAVDGMSDAQAIGQLFALSDYAARDPAGFVRWFAQQRGVSLESTTNEPDNTDPALKAVRDEVAALRAQRESEERARLQAEQSEIYRRVTEFQNAVSDTGEPEHPHFDAVRSDMAALIRANPGLSLEDAYERAVYANPETRKAVLSAQKAAEDAERAKAAKAKAEAARKAAGTPLRTPNGQFAPAARSMDDTLSAVYDAMSG